MTPVSSKLYRWNSGQLGRAELGGRGAERGACVRLHAFIGVESRRPNTHSVPLPRGEEPLVPAWGTPRGYRCSYRCMGSIGLGCISAIL